MVSPNDAHGANKCPHDTDGDGNCHLCYKRGKCFATSPDPAQCCGCCSANWLLNQFYPGCPECEDHYHQQPGPAPETPLGWNVVHGDLIQTPTVIDSEEKLLDTFGQPDSAEKFPPPPEELSHPGVIRVEPEQWGVRKCRLCGGPLEYDREREDVCCVCTDQQKSQDWESDFRAQFLNHQPVRMSSATFWLLAGGLVLFALYMTMELLR